MDERTVDVAELNQRLVEEISSLQLKMIDILRENFRLKSELETIKRTGGVWSTSAGVPLFSTARKHRFNVARDPVQTVCYKNHRHHHGAHQPTRLVALYEDPLPGGYSSSASSWDFEGEMDDLNRRVEDMDRVVARLDAQTRDHEGLYQEYIKMGTSLPSPSAFRKQGGSNTNMSISTSMPSPARIPPRPVEAPVEAAMDMSAIKLMRSNSPPQSVTPTVNSGHRTPYDIPAPAPHPQAEETHSMAAKGRLRRASTMGMVVPDEPHARIGHSDASSEAGKSIAEEF